MKKIKVIVKKKFLDRYTGISHKPGDKLTVDENRYREIQRAGDYVTKETVAAPKNEAAAPEKATNEIKK